MSQFNNTDLLVELMIHEISLTRGGIERMNKAYLKIA